MRVIRQPAGEAVRDPRASSGTTLVELMISMVVLSLAILGMVSTQLYCLRLDELVNSKSGACEMARLSFNDLMSDIKAAKVWNVGTGTSSSFVPVAEGVAHQGNALQLSLSADTSKYIVYYFNTNNGSLCRYHSGDANAKVIAQHLTNTMYFQLESTQGIVQTNRTYKEVVDVTMQFYQYQYPLTRIGPGYYYNFYQMQFRATTHVPDGA